MVAGDLQFRCSSANQLVEVQLIQGCCRKWTSQWSKRAEREADAKPSASFKIPLWSVIEWPPMFDEYAYTKLFIDA